jgi:Mn-dependent DtxR family transcriptional regulator
MTWLKTLEVLRSFPAALYPHYSSAMEGTLAKYNVQAEDWFILAIALYLDPEPITTERLLDQMKYNADSSATERIERASERGVLETVEAGIYQVTDQAREGFKVSARAAHEAIDKVITLDQSELGKIVEPLEQLVNACFSAPIPEQKDHLTRSKLMDPEEGTGLPSRIDQAITDLLSFRDDAHEAAWTPLGVSGHAWEILSTIWSDGEITLDEIAEKLQPRGFSQEQDEQALEELLAQGWIEKDEDQFKLTQAGKTVRDQAEAKTDEYYFRPWSVLSTDEIEEMTKHISAYVESMKIDDEETEA